MIGSGAFEWLPAGTGVRTEVSAVRPDLFLIAVINIAERPVALLGRVVFVAVHGSNRFGDVMAGIGYRELGRMTAFDVEVVAQPGMWPLSLYVWLVRTSHHMGGEVCWMMHENLQSCREAIAAKVHVDRAGCSVRTQYAPSLRVAYWPKTWPTR